MRYQSVCVEAVAYVLPPEVVSSEALEERLRPVYERLGLPFGRLEMMTGIRQRRFFPPGTLPSQVSAESGRRALEAAGFDPRHIGALIHGSVCRDQLEPATATAVHHALGLPQECRVFDVSNACLGLLNGMAIVADWIESGQIRAGLVVGTEDGRALVETTVRTLLDDPNLTRQSIKPAFASLTIGSGSAAILLCDARLSQTGRRLLGGVAMADTTHHRLCSGGSNASAGHLQGPLMETRSEEMLHAGVALAERTWAKFLARLHWSPSDVHKVFTHQVGRAHRNLLLQRLGLRPEMDFPTVEFLGNTGAVALPVAMAMGLQRGHVRPGERFALLGIGSGLNCMMLGLQEGG